MNRIAFALLTAALIISSGVSAESDSRYILPMDIPAELSANFGELRPNHYHSGVDFKTLQQIGIPIRSIADGYVSRINISGTGYGLALYVTHPDKGVVSVYAHCDSYSARVDSVLREHQYAEKRNNIDFQLAPGELPVKQGEVIAISGNSGSSGGPHLHFEIRDAVTEETIDPQSVYDIVDNVRPRFRRISVNPVLGEGVVDGRTRGAMYEVSNISASEYRLRQKGSVKAWGRIGIGVRANDYMTGTSNIYGICSMVVRVDGDTTFVYNNFRFSFDSSRYINSFIDYARWYSSGEMIMKTYVPSNYSQEHFRLVRGGGYINIDEQRDYKIDIDIYDWKRNSSHFSMTVHGDSTSLPVMMGYRRGEFFPWNFFNRHKDDDFWVDVPRGALFEDTYVQVSRKSVIDANGNSQLIYSIGRPDETMCKKATVSIRLHGDTLANHENYYIAQRVRGGGWSYAGAMFSDGWLSCRSFNLGDFKVVRDDTAPMLQYLSYGPGAMFFRMYDRESGINRWEVTVDGEWAPAFYDNKNNRLTYRFDDRRVQRGRTHEVVVTVYDNCGNSSQVRRSVKW